VPVSLQPARFRANVVGRPRCHAGGDHCDVEVREVESIQMLEQVFRWGAVVIVLAVVIP